MSIPLLGKMLHEVKMNTGFIIAISLFLIYCIFGPPLLFAVYVILDSFIRRPRKIYQKKSSANYGEPFNWTDANIDEYLRQK